MHILIIEDEEQLCRSMAEGLRMDGYETDTCFDGEEGLELCMTENYDLILLDLNLPGIDGLEILRQFRTFNTNTPVLILSARVQIQDKVEGLDLGANDYLTKPFHFEELEARIRSLTRRKFIQEDVCLRCSRITFDTRTREASVDGTPLALTRKESALLEYFLLHRNRIISPEEMIEHLWDGSVNSFSNSIRVHISSLRKKLLQLGLLVTSLLLLFVSVLGQINIGLSSLEQRTHELLIRRAIGASRTNIVALVLGSQLILSIFVCLAAILISLILVHCIGALLPVDSPVGTPSYPISVAVVAVAVSVLTALLGGLLPALKAAKLEPALALR